MRFRDGETRLHDGPFLDTEEFIACLDVVSCADRRQAIEIAAAHPFARYHAVEVRPFYSE
ncbi:MAG: YciI family protein [Solirubrobacteraceae bacterium]